MFTEIDCTGKKTALCKTLQFCIFSSMEIMQHFGSFIQGNLVKLQKIHSVESLPCQIKNF